MVADPDSGPDLNPPTRLGQDVLGHWPSIPHSHLHEIVSKGLCSAKGLVILGNMNASLELQVLICRSHSQVYVDSEVTQVSAKVQNQSVNAFG